MLILQVPSLAIRIKNHRFFPDAFAGREFFKKLAGNLGGDSRQVVHLWAPKLRVTKRPAVRVKPDLFGSLGLALSAQNFELKSLILAQNERWRRA